MLKVKWSDINKKQDKNFKIKGTNPQFDYIFHLFRTSTRFVINGEVFISEPDSIILFDGKKPQHFSTAEDFMLNDFVGFFADPEDLENIPFSLPLAVPNPEYFHQIFTLLSEELYSANAMKSQTSSALLSALLSKAKEAYSYYNTVTPVTKQTAELIKMRNDIFSRPNFNWQVDDMASTMNLSTSRFQCVYKKMFSTSPISDVIAARITMSKKLLRNPDLTVSEVAELSGYTNDVHFMRQFKKKTGITPSEYRKKHLSTQ